MQNSTGFHGLAFDLNFSAASPRSGCDDVFVKRKGYKNNDCQKVDYSAYRPHIFRAASKSSAPSKMGNLAFKSTYISMRLSFDISRPLRFAFMNVSPSHLIKLKVKANAMPLNAKDVIRGSPSP